MILIWYCFYNLNETAVCAIDIFLVVGELWTQNRKGAKKNILHTQSLVLFSLSMTQFVILTKIDVDWGTVEARESHRERGVISYIGGRSLLVIQKLGNKFKNSATERCWKKRVKRRESVQDENSNQVVWRFILTKPTCSTRILHRLFKSGNSICTPSSVFLNCQQMLLFFIHKRLFVSHFFPFFYFED